MTPSITYWNRIEPRSFTEREDALLRNLAAEVRDPLWLLARQWQVGEFRGEDAASPAFVSGAVARTPFPDRRPFEPARLAEGMPGDVGTAAEIGLWLEELLVDGGVAPDVYARARTEFPLAPRIASYGGQTSFGALARDRVPDGWSLAQAARADVDAVTARIAANPADRPATRTALVALLAEIEAVFGAVLDGAADPPAWVPGRLRYELTMEVETPTSEVATFAVEPDEQGHVDWFSFDVVSSRPAPSASTVETIPFALLPGFVRFRGMPNHRFWDFEQGTTDLGDLKAGLTDVARLVVMDFMLVHGNDWFVLPVDVPVGSVAQIRDLVVRDVFGQDTTIAAVGTSDPPSTSRWTMFTTTRRDSGALAPYLVLPPSMGSARPSGVALEDVRFLRDDTANMAWAIEASTTGALGEPVLADASAERDDAPASPPAAGLRYRIRTDVPAHWIPLLPVSIDPLRGQIELERGAMLDDDGNPIEPKGRVLSPTSLGAAPYRIREEEVPRTGVRIERQLCRSRWIDGSTHLWVQRVRKPGRGEGRSGLAFDITEGR